MEDLKLSEKELLILKGNALRMRLKAESNKTKKSFVNPLGQVKNTGLSLLGSPMVRTFALELLLKRLFTLKGVGYSALGLAALFLLQQNKNKF